MKLFFSSWNFQVNGFRKNVLQIKAILIALLNLLISIGLSVK